MQDLPKEVVDAYTESLNKHIAYVQEAGRKLGVPENLLECHDASKWRFPEFPGYAMHFHGGGAPDAFAIAWIHHIHHNPHHWQHWVFPDNFTPKGSKEVENGVLQMPEVYALEMVADWMGSSMAYTGSWDMTKWLHKNLHKVKLHSRTATYVREVLDDLGYEAL
jgi:hypothetical protein